MTENGKVGVLPTACSPSEMPDPVTAFFALMLSNEATGANASWPCLIALAVRTSSGFREKTSSCSLA
eukprot:501249-Pyramimonas_sp.AAC.1